MSLGHGPKIVTDGLVFAYDMGPNPGFNKSWKGAPTTNYFSVNNTTDLGNWTKESASVEVIATGEKFKGENVYKCKTQNGSIWVSFNSTPTGLTALTGNVTMSVMVKNTNLNAYNVTAYIGHDFSSVRTIAANSDWQKIQWTVPVSNMNNNYCEIRPYTNTDNVYLLMTMPQIEPGDFATPFTTGTRSNTQALLDWIGNNTIGVNNLVYNSDGSFSFNGSNSYIETTGDVLTSGSPYTIFGWIKPNGTNWGNNSFPLYNSYNSTSTNGIWHHFGTDNILRWRHASSSSYMTGDLSGIGLVANQWQMSTITWDGTTLKLYKNENLVNSTTVGTYTSSNGNGRIGMLAHRKTSNDYNWNGDIGVNSIYNRVLSATEVAQNFQALRGRYGI